MEPIGYVRVKDDGITVDFVGGFGMPGGLPIGRSHLSFEADEIETVTVRGWRRCLNWILRRPNEERIIKSIKPGSVRLEAQIDSPYTQEPNTA